MNITKSTIELSDRKLHRTHLTIDSIKGSRKKNGRLPKQTAIS